MAQLSIYKPLDRSRRQIRLMWLSSAHIESIHCIVEVFELDTAPVYKALSYEWGLKENMQTIHINGHQMQIRSNLFNFLQIYRRRKDQGWIWIDQLCIDQNHVLEKNHQVGIMEYIYRGAQETLVWLGMDEHHGAAFEILGNIINIGIDENSHYDEDFTKAMQDVRDQLGPKQMTAVCVLENLTYWSRIWIAQELLLSRRCTLLYGFAEFPFKELKTLWACCFFKVESALALLLCLRDPYEDESEETKLLKTALTEHITDFAEHSLCENLHDKVYALRSLLPDFSRPEVDYTLPLIDVYLGTVILWHRTMERKHPYNFLCHCVRLAQSMGLAKSFPIQFHGSRFPGYEFVQEQYQRYLRSILRVEVPGGHIVPWPDQTILVAFLEKCFLKPE